MTLLRGKLALSALLATAVIATGIVLAGQGGGKKAPAGEFVPVERGSVAVTVGGIGHVTTLTGAARLAVPAAPTGGAAGAGSPAAAAAVAAQVPADAVFATVPAHVSRVLVHVGQFVIAGEPIATLADDGTLATQQLQARSDLATSRLELAQKQIQDPLRGPPPTAAEVRAAGQAIVAARDKLHRILGPPLPSEAATARSDLAKAMSELMAARLGTPAAVSAAELAVATAQQKLLAVTGAPAAADVAAAQLDLARATVEQETLLHQPDAPTPAARAAAQLAVDAARARLDAVTNPPPAVVAAARQEIAKAQADLAQLQATGGTTGLAVARAAVAAAKAKLAALRHPARDVVSSTRLDLRKAQADFAVLHQRGSPAAPTELALARLKVDVNQQRLALAQQIGTRLTVRAPASGTVTSLLTTRGAAVDATTPVARVQDLRHLVVSLDLSEFDVGRTRVGARAQVSVDALGGHTFSGKVLDVALSGADSGGGIVNFPVTIALPAGGGLRPGMSVSARIVVKEARGVLHVPPAAVSDYGGNSAVMVRGPGGALQRRVVELGLEGPHSVEIRSGLHAGERVFVPAGG